MNSSTESKTRRQQTIDNLKHISGAVSFLEHANRTESALFHGLLSNDLWEASSFNDNPKNRIRAASTIRNLIRHNAMLGCLEELLKAHLNSPTTPFPVLLIALIVTLQDGEEEHIHQPLCKLCEYLVHQLDSIPQQKD